MEETNRVDTQEERGVTIGEICRTVFQWKRFLTLLAISLAVALAATLFVHFYYNPKATQYEVQFNWHAVRTASTSDLLTSGQFFAQEETLTAVKNSDESFAEVNIEDMLPNGKYPIRVSSETVLNEDELSESYWLISVNQSLFPNGKVESNFVRALIGYVKDKAVEDSKALSAKDEDGYNGFMSLLKTYESAQTYEEKLGILVSQRNFITGFYDGWIGSYGNLYNLVDENCSLMDLREEAQAVFRDAIYSELADDLGVNAYLPPNVPNSEDVLKARLNVYKEQLDLNERKLNTLDEALSNILDNYKGIGGGSAALSPEVGDFHARIAALTEENADLGKKIEIIEKRLSPEGADSEYLEREAYFGVRLGEIKNALMLQAEKLATVAEKISERESFVIILETDEEGGVSPILIAVIVTVLVFVIASAVCFSLVSRREKAAKQSGSSDPKNTHE